MNAYASTLCPTPWWRVPTLSDLNTLISCARGPYGSVGSILVAAWGCAGRAEGNTITDDGSYGYMWSSDAVAGQPLNLDFNDNNLYIADYYGKYTGLQVRCVLNTP